MVYCTAASAICVHICEYWGPPWKQDDSSQGAYPLNNNNTFVLLFVRLWKLGLHLSTSDRMKFILNR